MTKTYCGKDCELCTQKEQLGCWGCTDDKNRIQYRTCEIANCCWKMGHEQCGTCSFREKCDKLAKRDNMANYRVAQRDAEAMKKANALRKAPFMAKWLMIMFWVMIVSGIGGILSSDFVQESVPSLYYVGTGVNILGGLLSALIVLKLSCEEVLYRNAAYCYLGSTGISLITASILFFSTNPEGWILFSLFILITAAIVGLLGIYYEYKAHANVVRDTSEAMAVKWEELWGYFVKILIALVVLLMFRSAFGIIGIIASLIVLVLFAVVSIMKYVYLYEMAKLFQALAERKKGEAEGF